MTFRHITIRTGNTFGTEFRIIHNEIGMRRICARWIPHCMIDENQMRKKRPGMLQTPILHHDNARFHRAAQTTETIKRLCFDFLDNPFTHQTWPLVIFFLFPLIKSVFRGTRFEDVADRPVAVQQAIAEQPVNSKRDWFLSWVKRCKRLWITRGTILKGNGTVLCANVLANNDGTYFSNWCAGSCNLTLP